LIADQRSLSLDVKRDAHLDESPDGGDGEMTAQQAFDVPRSATRLVELTTRQSAIIDLIAAGRTDKEIALGLGISYRTVRTHLERLYDLNDLHCRAALVALFVNGRTVARDGELSAPDAGLHVPRAAIRARAHPDMSLQLEKQMYLGARQIRDRTSQLRSRRSVAD
jgi:DNA-binding CsgD family transcriptional regulator